MGDKNVIRPPGVPGAHEPRMYPRSGYFLVINISILGLSCFCIVNSSLLTKRKKKLEMDLFGHISTSSNFDIKAKHVSHSFHDNFSV